MLSQFKLAPQLTGQISDFLHAGLSCRPECAKQSKAKQIGAWGVLGAPYRNGAGAPRASKGPIRAPYRNGAGVPGDTKGPRGVLEAPNGNGGGVPTGSQGILGCG